MNPVAKAIWLGALTSGQYRQGRYALEAETDGQVCNCVFGVLTRVAQQTADIEVHVRISPQDGTRYFGNKPVQPLGGGYMRSGSAIKTPSNVLRWAGLVDPISGLEDLRVSQVCSALMLANDNGSSFAELAELIQDQL